MTHAVSQPAISLECRWSVQSRPRAILVGLALAGITAAAVHAAIAEHPAQRLAHAYLLAFAFVLSLSIGGLFFVLIQHLSHAAWSVLVRRFAEALALNMVVATVMFVPIAISVLTGIGDLYPWAHHATGGHEVHVPDRGLYYTPAIFVVRWFIFLAIWSAMGLFFWRNSVAQDQTRDHRATMRAETLAGPCTLLFGLTVILGAWDLIVSLDPHWASTILSVYYFAGGVIGALSCIILLVLGLQRRGILTPAISHSHYLDLGRLLFAFVFFWGYIAYSQYMLLWYANMPHTTGWLRVRGMTTVSADVNAWSAVALILLFGHFLMPFAGLMSRHVKGNSKLLAAGAIWMLVMHWVDLLWVIMPQLGTQLSLGGMELGLSLALLAIFGLFLVHNLGSCNLVPLGDPRTSTSASHESVY